MTLTLDELKARTREHAERQDAEHVERLRERHGHYIPDDAPVVHVPANQSDINYLRRTIAYNGTDAATRARARARLTTLTKDTT